MKRALSLGLGVVLLLALAGPSLGQAQRGAITVSVKAADGSVVPGATVTARSEETLTRRTAISDANGTATMVALDPSASYSVSVELEGFKTARFDNILVKAGQDTPLSAVLEIGEVSEELLVTAESPVVDVTSAIAGQEITLQLTESLPTARSYQDYLQLVPGVQAAIDPSVGPNPASRSGVNYQDDEGKAGVSTDNFYYFDGINVTDRTVGTFGANLNTEIIQEQSVLTGGIPAEYVGAPGLISNVVTKSGGNTFSGSVNYYFQNDSLVESNDHFPDRSFSTYDTAFTLGGPIVRDRAWFFASYRLTNRDDDVISPDTDEYLRTVSNDGRQAFGKISWAATDRDLFTGVYLSDPSDLSGSNNPLRSNARDFSREQGGDRYSFNYNRVFSKFSLELGYTDHQGDLNDTSVIPEPENTISFRAVDNPTQAEEQLGGFGETLQDTRGNEAILGSAEFLLDSSWGSHTLKAGVELGDSSLFENDNYFGNPQARYVSVSTRYQSENITLGELETTFTEFAFISDNQDNVNGLNDTLASHPGRDLVLDLWDLNGDGFLSGDELAQVMVFNNTAGNPNGQVNYSRDLQTAEGPRTMSSDLTVAYVQDTWQWSRWSVNAGVRAEIWEHFASTGDSIIKFDTVYAPRLSIAYDLRGNGRQRLSLYYGRYHDAIRNDMTDFAGSLTGRIIEEQVWVAPLDEFVTYRTRGGPTQQDGFFAPSIKTPYTDEIQLGYKQDLGRNMSFEVNLIDRTTKDIMEDFSPTLYTDPADYVANGGDLDHPDSLFLGEDYFGFGAAGQPAANFFIATLPPEAFRDWQGVELVFRKRYSDHWQMLASYNYADASGNSNSDGNADFQGDVLWLDPRSPNVEGTQPGLVEHLFKAAASYTWDNGFQLGGSYRWNSGLVLNTSSAVIFDRHIPLRVAQPFEFAGFTNQRWVDPAAVGTLEHPSYGILDLRAAYLWDFGNRYTLDIFLDVFNALDEQDVTRIQDVVGGNAGFDFGQGITFVDPRRYFIGARLRF